MKNTFKKTLLALLLGASAFTSSLAQQEPITQNYWVVETNLKQRDYSIVRFYNQNHQLIYEEKLNGKYLNISRPRHVKRLNLALSAVSEKSFAAVNQQKVVSGFYHR